MMNRTCSFTLILAAVSFMVLVGCQQHGHRSDAGDQDAHGAEPAILTGEHQHDVRCGCALSEVGECGNYIEVEGQFVELVLPEDNDLGKTPFCGQSDVVAQVQGEMVDGKFVATSFEYVE